MSSTPAQQAERVSVPGWIRGAVRFLVLLATVAALLLTTSVADLGRATRAAAGPKRAVIVVGPVGSLTDSYLARGRAVADAAEARGMEVTRIFHPRATWRRLVAAANGADLFVYLGHGNGWPSPYRPYQEDTKDGVGLNPSDGATNAHDVKYKGADHIRASIRFAPNAIVILNRACYTAGNGEDHHPIPTRAVARQRVDNYAAGFLAAGARTVFALTSQSPATIIDSLFEGSDTMDGIFGRRFDQGDSPGGGWIGWKPDIYLDSERSPGARLHLDPHPTEGYRRAVTGDLGMTTDEWLGGIVDDGDLVAPELSDVTVNQAADTVPADDGEAAVFTPNGDGLSDTVTIRHTLSEPAYLDVQIRRAGEDRILRQMRGWSGEGRSTTTWNGRKDGGDLVGDGRFRVTITPRDRAGNIGQPADVTVKVLTALKGPKVSPPHFDPTDGDELAATVMFSATLRKAATLTWQVSDAQGNRVRTGLDGELEAGGVSWTWDGLDDAGSALPRGVYTAKATVQTNLGGYSHSRHVRLMPFKLVASDWSLRRRQAVSLRVLSAEPVTGRPTITVKQPGKAAFDLRVDRQSADEFKARLTVKPGGGDGTVTVTVTSTDTDGGAQTQVFRFSLD